MAYFIPDGGIAGIRSLAQTWREADVTLFLSSEEFSRGGGPGGRVDMALLHSIFDGFEAVQVLCLLRSQWQFLQSVYLEISRSRPPPPPLALLETALTHGMVDGLWCDYNGLIDDLKTGFDPKNFCMMSFDRAMLRPDGIIGAVLDFLGVALLPEDRQRITAYRANRSPQPLSTWASFAVAGGQMPSDALQAAARTAWDLEFGPERKGCLFTRRELDVLRLRFVPANARLPCALPWRAPGTDTIFRDDLSADFWTRLARRIYFDQAGPSPLRTSVNTTKEGVTG